MLNKKASLCLIFFRQFVAVVVVAVVFQCFSVFWFCRGCFNALLLINFQCFLYWSLSPSSLSPF